MADRLISWHRGLPMSTDETTNEVYCLVLKLLEPEYGEKAGEIASKVSKYFLAQLNENP